MSQPVLRQLDAVRNIKRLRRILEATKLLNSTIDLAVLTGIILKIVREEVHVDRGTVFVVERERRQIRSLVAQGVEGEEIFLSFGSGIAGTVAMTGETINIPEDAYGDSRFNPNVDARLQYRTKDIFCMPIGNREGQTVGVLQLLNRAAPFSEDDLEFLHSVSMHIGLALENAWLYRQLLEKRKMEQELVLARDIQQNLCPGLPDSCSGVQMAASSTMCEAVGGDYLDYYQLTNGRFIVMLGDVSGKGIGAALVMTSLHATCRALLRHVDSVERIALILNESLIETTRAQTFVTLIAVLVDSASKKLHCVRAGHLPPLLLDERGESRWLEHGGGLPIGLFSDLKLGLEIHDVPAGSTLVLYTDGVTEAESATGEHFGTARLDALVKAHHSETAASIHEAIRGSLKDFMGECRQTDDSTLVVLKF
jgi:phosphoserine phosphatase RsbU/P